MDQTTWKVMICEEMIEHGECWDDIVDTTLSDQEANRSFDDGYGGTEGAPFTVWTEKSVYFPVCYDGAEWVGRVSRNPDGVATGHLGGG